MAEELKPGEWEPWRAPTDSEYADLERLLKDWVQLGKMRDALPEGSDARREVESRRQEMHMGSLQAWIAQHPDWTERQLARARQEAERVGERELPHTLRRIFGAQDNHDKRR